MGVLRCVMRLTRFSRAQTPVRPTLWIGSGSAAKRPAAEPAAEAVETRRAEASYARLGGPRVSPSTPVLPPARGEEAPRHDRHGHPGRAPSRRCSLRHALQLRAGERGPGG